MTQLTRRHFITGLAATAAVAPSARPSSARADATGIVARTRVLEVKESSSKPDRGVVLVETKGFNQDGKEVCYFRRRVMVWKREFDCLRSN